MAKESLEERIQRLEAVREIGNVMGKYEFLLAAGKGEEILALFAKRDDITFDIGDWGVYKGVEGLRRSPISGIADMTGFGAEIALTTSVIEVARDGKTAKAAWMAPGYETTRNPKTGKLTAGWVWTKYACDFIKEDGEWKLWHLKNFLVFFAEYHKSWVEEGGEHYLRRPPLKTPLPKGALPPAHRHLPYDPNAKPEMLPAFPKPYETYDGSMDWVDPGKPRK
jgi:hypothetical protein